MEFYVFAGRSCVVMPYGRFFRTRVGVLKCESKIYIAFFRATIGLLKNLAELCFICLICFNYVLYRV